MKSTAPPVQSAIAVAVLFPGRIIMAGRFYTYVSRERQDTDGVNDKWLVTSQSVARENSRDASPYLIPNEWIATNIAWLMGLPVPPPALMRKNRIRMFCSLSFDSADGPPRDARPARCVAELPDLCTGIVVFDILVANSDRHDRNLKVDDPIEPKRIDLFDHDRCLFGWESGRARHRLQALNGRLGISAGSVSGGNPHCFLNELATCVHFPGWIDRAEKIPDFFIDRLCSEAVGAGVNRATSDLARDFLNCRKMALGSIIRENQSSFPMIHDWGLFV